MAAYGGFYAYNFPVSGGGGDGNATSIQSIPVSSTTPISGQVLEYNGSEWAPTYLSNILKINTVGTGVGADYESIAEAFLDGKFRLLGIANITETQDFTFSPSTTYNVDLQFINGSVIHYNGFSPFLSDPTTIFNTFKINGGTHIPDCQTGVWANFGNGIGGDIVNGSFVSLNIDLTGSDATLGVIFFATNSKFFDIDIIYSGDDSVPQTIFRGCRLASFNITGSTGISHSTKTGIQLSESTLDGVAVFGSWDISSSESSLDGCISTQDASVANNINAYAVTGGLFAVIGTNINGLRSSSSYAGKIIALTSSVIGNINSPGSVIYLKGLSSIANCTLKNIAISSYASSPTGTLISNVNFTDTSSAISTSGLNSTPIRFNACTSRSGFEIDSNNASIVDSVSNNTTGSPTITVNAGANNAVVVGNSTKVAIVDNGTGTVSSGNVIVF